MKTLSEKDIRRLEREGKVEKPAYVAPKKPVKGNGEDKQLKLLEKSLEIAQMQGDKTIEISTLSNHLATRLLEQINGIKKPIDVKIDVKPAIPIEIPKPIRNWKFTVKRDYYNYITEINAEAVD